MASPGGHGSSVGSSLGIGSLGSQPSRVQLPVETAIDRNWQFDQGQHKNKCHKDAVAFLERTLQALAKNREPGEHDGAARQATIERLQHLLRDPQLFPPPCRLQLVPYGSFLSTCYSRSSDLDLALTGEVSDALLGPREKSKDAGHGHAVSLERLTREECMMLLLRLAHALEHRQLTHGRVDRSPLEARVPIIKFEEAISKIECDVCVTTRGCDFKGSIMRLLHGLQPSLAPLIQLVKVWAKHHDINSAHCSTLNSWSLALMVVFSLQSYPRGHLLPPLWRIFHDEEPAGPGGTGRPLQDKNLPLDVMLCVAESRCGEDGERLLAPLWAHSEPPTLLEHLLWFLSCFATIMLQWRDNAAQRNWRVSTWLGRGQVGRFPKAYVAAVEEPFDCNDNTARSLGIRERNENTLPYIAWVFGHSVHLLRNVATVDDAARVLTWLFGAEALPCVGLHRLKVPSGIPKVALRRLERLAGGRRHTENGEEQQLDQEAEDGERVDADYKRRMALRALIDATKMGSPIMSLDDWKLYYSTSRTRPPHSWHPLAMPSAPQLLPPSRINANPFHSPGPSPVFGGILLDNSQQQQQQQQLIRLGVSPAHIAHADGGKLPSPLQLLSEQQQQQRQQQLSREQQELLLWKLLGIGGGSGGGAGTDSVPQPRGYGDETSTRSLEEELERQWPQPWHHSQATTQQHPPDQTKPQAQPQRHESGVSQGLHSAIGSTGAFMSHLHWNYVGSNGQQNGLVSEGFGAVSGAPGLSVGGLQAPDGRQAAAIDGFRGFVTAAAGVEGTGLGDSPEPLVLTQRYQAQQQGQNMQQHMLLQQPQRRPELGEGPPHPLLPTYPILAALRAGSNNTPMALGIANQSSAREAPAAAATTPAAFAKAHTDNGGGGGNGTYGMAMPKQLDSDMLGPSLLSRAQQESRPLSVFNLYSGTQQQPSPNQVSQQQQQQQTTTGGRPSISSPFSFSMSMSTSGTSQLLSELSQPVLATHQLQQNSHHNHQQEQHKHPELEELLRLLSVSPGVQPQSILHPPPYNQHAPPPGFHPEPMQPLAVGPRHAAESHRQPSMTAYPLPTGPQGPMMNSALDGGYLPSTAAATAVTAAASSHQSSGAHRSAEQNLLSALQGYTSQYQSGEYRPQAYVPPETSVPQTYQQQQQQQQHVQQQQQHMQQQQQHVQQQQQHVQQQQQHVQQQQQHVQQQQQNSTTLGLPFPLSFMLNNAGREQGGGVGAGGGGDTGYISAGLISQRQGQNQHQQQYHGQLQPQPQGSDNLNPMPYTYKNPYRQHSSSSGAEWPPTGSVAAVAISNGVQPAGSYNFSANSRYRNGVTSIIFGNSEARASIDNGGTANTAGIQDGAAGYIHASTYPDANGGPVLSTSRTTSVVPGAPRRPPGF